MNPEPQKETAPADEWQAMRRAHDRRWCYLMVVVIAVGVAMPFPLNVFQVWLGGARLVAKILRLMERRP